jgi:glycosyltransferase involved in cell wall biosynthesis
MSKNDTFLTTNSAIEPAPDLRKAEARQSCYVIITPARNEAENIAATLQSVVAQTNPPVEWVIVNDGSTDRTAEILDQYAARYPWIRAYHLPDRGFREPGSGVVRAFNHGLGKLKTKDWDFIVKLDGDLELSADYFENCLNEFEKDVSLAVGGGTICHNADGVMRPDVDVRFHVRGATKIYRREFWDQMGGLPPVVGWDTLDELKANMLGWTSRSFPQIRILHRRPTGAADGAWRNWFKNGRANYITGYHPLFMTLKCVKRVPQKPYFLAALGLFCGFVSGYINHEPQVADRELILYVRKQQLRRLFWQSSIWK